MSYSRPSLALRTALSISLSAASGAAPFTVPGFAPAARAAEPAANNPNDPAAAARAAKARAQVALGKARLAGQRYAEAEAAFRAALETLPDNAAALDGLATAMEKQGKHEEAAKVYEREAEVMLRSAAAPKPADAGRPAPGQPAAGQPVAPQPAAAAQPSAPAAAPQAPAASAPPAARADLKETYAKLLDPGPPAVGQKVLAQDYTGGWYPAAVVKVDGAKRFVRFDGYSDASNAWVEPDHVRPADFNDRAVKAMPPTVGERVEGRYQRDTWQPATVIKVDGPKRLVRFDKWGPAYDQWVQPIDVRPGPATTLEQDEATKARANALAHPAPAQPGKHDMNGWWVVTKINVYSSRLDCTYYWFRPDGRVYFSPGAPTTFADADFARLQQSEPQNAGTYGQANGQITVQRNGGEPGGLGGGVLQQVFQLRDGLTLSGSWSITGAASFGGVATVHGDQWVFRPDGTFEHKTYAGADTQDNKTGGKPLHEAGVTAAGGSLDRGRYQFTGGTLRLTGADGKTNQALPACGIGSDPANPSPLVIGGKEYHHDS